MRNCNLGLSQGINERRQHRSVIARSQWGRLFAVEWGVRGNGVERTFLLPFTTEEGLGQHRTEPPEGASNATLRFCPVMKSPVVSSPRVDTLV